MPKTAGNPTDYILPLYMSGLSGRMLRLPAPSKKKREILLIAGHHTSIERVMGFAQYLNRYGSVTSPDLPGFGGMDSLYKIGEKPDLDTMADYLASFIKFRYRGRKFTIIAISNGFLVVTKMLQRYPELAGKIELLVSVAGFVSKYDFGMPRWMFWSFRWGTSIFSNQIPAALAKNIFLHRPVIRGLYAIAGAKHAKLGHFSGEERDRILEFEVGLWKNNDLRTYMETGVAMFTTDLRSKPVDLPVYHVAVDKDHFFNLKLVEQNMRTIYKDFNLLMTKMPTHAPSVVATAEETAVFVPPKLRALLRKKV